MDLKALIAKMDEIESKQVLTESEDRKPAKKTEREVELPSGAKVKTTKVQGWQSQKADKEADKERKKNDESISFKSSIAQAILKEFNYQEEDLEEETLDEADFQFSPEQEKWLGGANRQDPYIIARMPGPKPPLTYFTDPADQAIAKQMNIGQDNLNSIKKVVGMNPGDAQTFADPTTAKPAAGQAASPAKPAAAPQATAQGDDDGNTLVTTAGGATVALGPDGKPLPNGGRVAPAPGAQAGAPGAQDDATGVDAAVAANAADDAKRAAAGGQAASPAKPKATPDPKVKALQDKLIAAGAKITPDGIMGPQTQAAMKQFPQAVSGNLPLPAGVTPSTAGGGRGGQGGPTAAQAAQAAPSAKPAPQIPSSAGGTNMTPGTPGFDFKKASAAANATAPTGQAASPAAPAAPAFGTNAGGAATGGFRSPKSPARRAAGESVSFAEEDIVARIRHLSGL